MLFDKIFENQARYLRYLIIIWLDFWKSGLDIDGLAQEYSIPIANALAILQSCTKPSILSSHQIALSHCPIKHLRITVTNKAATETFILATCIRFHRLYTV